VVTDPMIDVVIDADLEELVRGAGVLHRVAGQVALRSRALAADPRLLPVAGGLLRRSVAVESLAARLRATEIGYRSADVASAVAVAMTVRALVGPLVPLTGLPTTGDAIAGVEHLMSPWFRESPAVRVRAQPVARGGPLRGVAGVLGRVPATGLHVEALTGPAGGRAWLVAIPGTANWSPSPGRTPFDLMGDVRLMAGHTSAGQAAVLAALRSLGARRGEPVMLAGHSQGGLIAASLAARADVRAEFTITQVVTSGAPIALVDLPRTVNTLSIEHTNDPVPRADGRANPVRPGWITVRAPAPAGLLEPLRPHRSSLYRATASLVDRTPDPALDRWRADAAGFLRAEPSAAWDVTVTRR
jgi:pimeloyl-ACP methyl ester carboxylesterase